MKIFIWRNVDNLTYNYHSDGGLVIVATDLLNARLLMTKVLVPEECSAFTTDPDVSADTSFTEEKIWIFPNAGCC